MRPAHYSTTKDYGSVSILSLWVNRRTHIFLHPRARRGKTLRSALLLVICATAEQLTLDYTTSKLALFRRWGDFKSFSCCCSVNKYRRRHNKALARAPCKFTVLLYSSTSQEAVFQEHRGHSFMTLLCRNGGGHDDRLFRPVCCVASFALLQFTGTAVGCRWNTQPVYHAATGV